MKIKELRATHPSYDAERWSDLQALSKGGRLFRDKISKFLPQNQAEPGDIYNKRKSQAHYTSYMGPVINLYVSWLFAADFTVKPTARETHADVETPSFYGAFQEDVGGECTLKNFMRERFREALVSSKSHFVIELPSNDGNPAETLDEFEKRGLGRATLRAVENHHVLDWEEDDEGGFKWVMVHTREEVRESVTEARDTVVETFRCYTAEEVATYELRYKKTEKPRNDDEAPAPLVAKHGFKRVPVLKIELPIEVCIGEQTHDPQLEHFRIDNALSWLIRRTCYAQPVFYVEDPEQTIPKMGTGYAIALGHQDKFGWTSPPAVPFDVLQKNVEAKRDEIYRVTHQMAQAVDNNAETVGRSADSKEIDAAATRIMLNAYGEYVAEALEETYEIISEARPYDGDLEWSVTGFSGYDIATVSSLIADATAARKLGVPSKTFHREMCTKVTSAILAGEDPKLKDKIRAEIMEADFDVSSKPLDEVIAKSDETVAEIDAASKAEVAKINGKNQIAAAKAAPKPAAPKPKT